MTDERFTLAVRHKEALDGFMQHEGWELLAQILRDQIEVRRNSFELTPLESLMDLGKQEFAKGEIAALRLVLALPKDLIADAEAMIAELTPDEEKDDGEES